MRNQLSAARGINIALGVWLFISAFLWMHTDAQFTNTWMVGLLSVAFAVIGMWAPQARYLNAVLSVWLFVSVWALPVLSMMTVWNNVLVSIGMFVVSILPMAPPVTETPRGPRSFV